MEPYTVAKTLTDKKLRAFQDDILNLRNKGKLLDQRHSTLLKKQHDLARIHGGNNAHGSDIIELNVGGMKMRVLRETLTLIRGSRLEAVFSGRWESRLLRDDEGCVFMDVDPRHFEKIVEYLYSIRVHQEDGKKTKSKVPELPRFEDFREQKVFDLYVEFFRLKQGGNKDCGQLFSASDKAVVGETKEEGPMSYKDLLVVFKNEEKELEKAEKRLDEMEEALSKEQDFVSYFTVDRDTAGEEEHCCDGEDDDISFATLSSNSSNSSNSSTISHGGSGEVSEKEDEILNLWLCGKVIPVKRSTICQCEGSRLAKDLNNDDWIAEHLTVCKDGTVLIMVDHPPPAFMLIINYLRLRAMMSAIEDGEERVPSILTNYPTGSIDLGDIVSKLFEGEEEFILGNWRNVDSEIITSSTDKDHIKIWLAEVSKISGPQLLYRASRDGWDTNDFHSKCDDKGATVTIVKTSEGYVFGGYTDQSWASEGHWKSSNEAFLFSLKCHAGLAPVKMRLKSGENRHAMYCSSNWGLGFGNDDIYVGIDNSSLKNGYTNLGNTYELPSGVSNTFLTGKHGYCDRFQVAEVEVFRV